MKKLFTLLAFLAVFMGAKAEWVEDYKIDYSTYTGFPLYVMGFVPEWVDGVMTDFGANYRYETQANLDGDGDGKWKDGESSVGTVSTNNGTEYQKVTGAGPYWHQYFVADGVATELDGSYKITAMIKASEEINLELQMGWGQWWTGTAVTATAKVGTEWAEVVWEFSGIGGTSCNVDAKPGNSTATIEWKWLKVEHNAKAQRPTTWQQWLTNDGKSIIPGVETESKYMGDAETAWPAWALEQTDGVNINWRGDRTGEICAWALTMGRNYQESVINDDSPRARPYPADIEAEAGNESNHVFAIHVDQIGVIDAPTPDDNSIQWSNQFWIQSPQGWKEGTQVRIKFRYKAAKAAKAATQIHKQNPSNYLHWNAVGDVNFTTEWQEFDKTVTFDGSQATGWSLAFNLCAESTKDAPQEPNIFYFDDLSWETMVLDEGYFVAGSNPDEGLEYDFDNAIEFKEDGLYADAPLFTATIGEKDAYVNQIMISTIRGNDASFKSNTLKLDATIKNDPDEWLNYTPASLAKLTLPGTGIWKIYLVPEYKAMAFQMLEGTVKEALDVVTNKTEIIVKGVEREDLIDTWDNNNQSLTVREDADNNPNDEHGLGGDGHNGQTWDNQFFIIANRELSKGEVTHLKFSYKASKEAKTTTQSHVAPGAYKHWGSIGDVNFTTDWVEFDQDFTVPDEADGMKSIAFNMAEIKEACDYEIKDVQWYLKDASLEEGKTWENLINETGTKNFYVKEGAGTDPYEYGTGGTNGINSVVTNNAAATAVIYNLAGQRVDNDYKGIVVKNGKKVMVK